MSAFTLVDEAPARRGRGKAIEQVEVASMRDYQKQWKESISRLTAKYSTPPND